LIDASRRLAADFDLPVEFFRGSFVPAGTDFRIKEGGFAWLATDMDLMQEDPGLDADDFDVIFAYPWPDEEGVTEGLFDRHARAGAVLVTYHGGSEFRVRRRKGKNKARRGSG